MNKRTQILIICLALFCTILGCSQLTTSQPTVVFEKTLISTPTVEPLPPQTSQPVTAQIPGWTMFEARGIEIWLPESYEGGNLDEDLDLILERLRSLGPDFEQSAQLIEQNPSLFVMWAFDTVIGKSGLITNVTMGTEQVFSAMTLDMYCDLIIEQLTSQYQVVERDSVALSDREAVRMVLEFTNAVVVAKQLVYLIRDGNNVWTINFTTGADEFEQRLPTFEQIATSFTVQQ